MYYPKISDGFDHEGSASLNMRIMDHSMGRPLDIPELIFQAKVTKIWRIGRSKHVNKYKFRYFS